MSFIAPEYQCKPGDDDCLEKIVFGTLYCLLCVGLLVSLGMLLFRLGTVAL